jgi:tetratricopeptide (TPR) repeat protein
MWQLASYIADQQGMLARSIACEETALDLVLGKISDKVDVEMIRKSHANLLRRYEKLACAVATFGNQSAADLTRRVVRTADRWRSLDDDATGPCHAAAKVFQSLGAEALAWDYLTTPLALRPNEAAPWKSLAETLRDDGQFDLADRAYAAAFEAEATNAQLLWDRIQLLEQAGRRGEATKLLRQLANGTWQPRFDHLRRKASRLLPD